jgi:hypothetical protein
MNEGVEVHLHAFLTSALGEVEWSASCPWGLSTQYPLDRSHIAILGAMDKENSLPPSGIELDSWVTCSPVTIIHKHHTDSVERCSRLQDR